MLKIKFDIDAFLNILLISLKKKHQKMNTKNSYIIETQ